MADDSEFVEEEQTQGDDMEAGRIARFFIFKNRDKSVVKRAQLRAVQDQARDSRKKNSIDRARQILERSLGLTIIDYVPPGKKQTSSKLFLTRQKKFPKDLPIPFSSLEKKQYGILILVFMAIHFKNGKIDLDQLWQVLENAGISQNSDIIGHWPDQIHIWTRQEYLKEKKIETDTGPKIEVSYGARFYVEYGEEEIIRMAKYMINDGNEPEEQHQQDDASQDPTQTQTQTQSQSGPISID